MAAADRSRMLMVGSCAEVFHAGSVGAGHPSKLEHVLFRSATLAGASVRPPPESVGAWGTTSITHRESRPLPSTSRGEHQHRRPCRQRTGQGRRARQAHRRPWVCPALEHSQGALGRRLAGPTGCPVVTTRPPPRRRAVRAVATSSTVGRDRWSTTASGTVSTRRCGTERSRGALGHQSDRSAPWPARTAVMGRPVGCVGLGGKRPVGHGVSWAARSDGGSGDRFGRHVGGRVIRTL